jgi:O-antigen ligase
MGTFGPVADLFYPFFLVERGQIPHAHNIFLQVAVDLGLPGLVAWTMIVIQIFKIAWQLYCYGRQKGEALSRRWRMIKRSTNRFYSAHGMTTVNQLTQSKRRN